MKQQVAAGAAWTAASNWVEQAVALAVYIAIARLIGAEAFGVASMALAFVMLAEVLLRDTLSEGLISKQEAAREDEDAVFWSLIALALIAVGAIMAAAPLVARIFAEPEVAPLMQSFAPVCLLIAISGVPTAKLRRNMAFRMLAARAIAGVVAGGVVGIALLKNLLRQAPSAVCIATDIDDAALDVARANAARHGVGASMRFLKTDGLSGLADLEEVRAAGGAHALTSNPPYIPDDEWEGVPAVVKDFEPHGALRGGADGFAVAGPILRGAPEVLRPGGVLIVELAASRVEEGRRMAASTGGYDRVQSVRDQFDRPRAVLATRASS